VIGSNQRLWFGPIAAVLFFAGIFAIGLMIPDYSSVRQTVSELGEIGSPGRVVFSVLLCLVAASLIIFAGAVGRILRGSGHSGLPAYFVGAMAISAAGVGIFAFPHPLHNVFGMSELVGYQAPLVAALVCRKDQSAKTQRVFDRHVRGSLAGYRSQHDNTAPTWGSLGSHPSILWRCATVSFRGVVFVVRRVWSASIARTLVGLDRRRFLLGEFLAAPKEICIPFKAP
jgi:Protein of unknown function (DUF998)